MTDSALRLVWIYPDLLSTYGDRGNVLVVERRARQRGLQVERVDVRSDQPVPTSGDIYLIGGPTISGAAIDAGLVDELRLIVYPLIVGDGKALFSSASRHAMQLHKIEQLPEGRLSMVYGIGQ